MQKMLEITQELIDELDLKGYEISEEEDKKMKEIGIINFLTIKERTTAFLKIIKKFIDTEIEMFDNIVRKYYSETEYIKYLIEEKKRIHLNNSLRL